MGEGFFHIPLLARVELDEGYYECREPLENLYNLEAFILVLANDVNALGRFVSDQSYTEANVRLTKEHVPVLSLASCTGN